MESKSTDQKPTSKKKQKKNQSKLEVGDLVYLVKEKISQNIGIDSDAEVYRSYFMVVEIKDEQMYFIYDETVIELALSMVNNALKYDFLRRVET